MTDKILKDYQRFSNLTFSDFKKMAVDSTLSPYEKIGFPNEYREGKEDLIFSDILTKLTHLNSQRKRVLDIGAGCSELPLKLIDCCKKNQHQLFAIDSQEMLDQLPGSNFITKIPAFYPAQCHEWIEKNTHSMDVILCYSVMQYIFVEANLFDFIDCSLRLLAEGGQMLLGDVPNASKRKRFLSSAAGLSYHQQYYDASTIPNIETFKIEDKQIDDGIILGILVRCRNAGFNAYIMPQSDNLPMANRREDILIVKP